MQVEDLPSLHLPSLLRTLAASGVPAASPDPIAPRRLARHPGARPGRTCAGARRAGGGAVNRVGRGNGVRQGRVHHTARCFVPPVQRMERGMAPSPEKSHARREGTGESWQPQVGAGSHPHLREAGKSATPLRDVNRCSVRASDLIAHRGNTVLVTDTGGRIGGRIEGFDFTPDALPLASRTQG